MKNMLRESVYIAFVFSAVLTIGCQRSGLSGLVPASGSVTYQGKPVEGADIAFSPDFQGRAAVGKSDADGKFQLTTLNPNDGAQPGNYKVAISKSRIVDPMTAEEAEAWFHKHPGPPPTKPLANDLPNKYASVDTSGLTATVAESGENQFTFELK